MIGGVGGDSGESGREAGKNKILVCKIHFEHLPLVTLRNKKFEGGERGRFQKGKEAEPLQPLL